MDNVNIRIKKLIFFLFRRWMLSDPEMKRLLHQFEWQYLTDFDSEIGDRVIHETGLSCQNTIKNQINNLVGVM